MRAKSTIQIGALSLVLFLSLAGAESAQAQSRSLQHTVSVRVPSVVRILPGPVAVGPTGLPVFRVVTNDPSLRRRLEEGSEGGLVAERLVAYAGRGSESTADFRYTVVAP
jgi:hypothetical protein